MNELVLLDPLDSDDIAAAARAKLDLDRRLATHLGQTARAIGISGKYETRNGRVIEISSAVEQARSAKESVPPDAHLPEVGPEPDARTEVRVVNATTFMAARSLIEEGFRTMALNFANGIYPGGGFLHGARAQEEVLCRSSALYITLRGDEMYASHRKRKALDSSDWIIHSPGVPVFRDDGGTPLDEPWLLNFFTYAAPYAPGLDTDLSHELLDRRIRRVLHLAAARGYEALVLGAWGCGAFQNDPKVVSKSFRRHLEDFAGCFRKVEFAIVDGSPSRETLKPFVDAFSVERRTA